MRNLTLGTLTTLLLTLGISPGVQAETMSSNKEKVSVEKAQNVRSQEAFDLVASAYRGELESVGIPSYYQLQQAYEAEELDAQTLVNRAIAAGELSPAAAEDEEFINAVRLHLDGLSPGVGR